MSKRYPPRERILLVEDNADDEALTVRALRQAQVTGDIVVVRDGALALDWLFCSGEYAGRDHTRKLGLVILDLDLPKVHGLDVLRSVREDQRTRLLPIVVMTSSGNDRDVRRSYELGANSYVRKSVDSEEFSESVEQIGRYWLGVNTPPSPSSSGGGGECEEVRP